MSVEEGRSAVRAELMGNGEAQRLLTQFVEQDGHAGHVSLQIVATSEKADGAVQFFVHRDVPQISPSAPTASRLERYTFRTSALMQHTADAKAACLAAIPSA